MGVYPVPEAPEPVHLIEVVVRDSPGFDPAEFVQPDPDQPDENWQTAYDERALNASGDRPITESFELSDRPDLFAGDVRFVFFMHYLDRLDRCQRRSGLPSYLLRPRVQSD